MTIANDLETAASRFVDLLVRRVIDSGRGTRDAQSIVAPSRRFFLGHLAPEAEVQRSTLGDRAERMTPCAIGVRVRPTGGAPWSGTITARATAWWQAARDEWHKTSVCSETLAFLIEPSTRFPLRLPLAKLNRAIASEVGSNGHLAQVEIVREAGRDGTVELLFSVVNCSPIDGNDLADTNLYEVEMELHGLATQPFLQEGLADSFRYDRRVPAYGLNCGIEQLAEGRLRTTDTVIVDRQRPRFWSVDDAEPDLRFTTLARDPLPSLRELVGAHRRWGERAWSSSSLDERGRVEAWSGSMREQATNEAKSFAAEATRMADGLTLLEQDATLLRAFRLTNAAMQLAAHGRYEGWRPFQVGFQIAALASVLDRKAETDVVDVLWFATGGGKTETYLGLLVLAALHDRIRGKTHGITAWSRFPLRLLSLQQTQRFADAMAGAEQIRRREKLGGDPFRVGFFVGSGNTPNDIPKEPKPKDADPYDPQMPAQFKVLLHCPFCRGDVRMQFDLETWTLQHRCTAQQCTWTDGPLPFHVVDSEVYRFLPTIVVGTLDKAASLGFQAAMRGFVGAPLGLCSRSGHGHTYTRRRSRPNGCRVPDCSAPPLPLPQDARLYRMSFRLQDELHLLRDSLGAVDSHYESLLDGLADELTGGRPKVLASSATLAGFEHQCASLYSRGSRVFPVPGPRAGNSFWSEDSDRALRRFVALAPRGVTLEYVNDRMLTVLQQTVRSALARPRELAAELEIDESMVSQLVSLYGTQVVYGNTIRDLNATLRSLDTQVQVDGSLNGQELSGNTPFEHVRGTLQRLEKPEDAFEDRVHVVVASSMMSHGVDVDRLNCMMVLGHPLTTAEFIQATARIGRKWPGIVFVLHKMGRERDASLFRSFRAFVEQGDRFVEAIPITRRSRRVLERTISGLGSARLLLVEELRIGSLVFGKDVVQAMRNGQLSSEQQQQVLTRLLGLTAPDDEGLRDVVRENLDGYFRTVRSPSSASVLSRRFGSRIVRAQRGCRRRSWSTRRRAGCRSIRRRSCGWRR